MLDVRVANSSRRGREDRDAAGYAAHELTSLFGLFFRRVPRAAVIKMVGRECLIVHNLDVRIINYIEQ